MSDAKPLSEEKLAMYRRRAHHTNRVDALVSDDGRTLITVHPLEIVATIDAYAARVRELEAVIEGEREANRKARDALDKKDQAMGVLFERLLANKIDFSDLIP